MRIGNIRYEAADQMVRVVATVTWEDCERPQQDIYFGTLWEHKSDLSCETNAFLTACAVPAMQYGERRIAIDGEVCPVLHEGLLTALSWIRYWRNLNHTIPEIEAPVKVRAEPVPPERTGMFLSGGIDSLFTLRWNRLHIGRHHPFSVQDALIVKGIERYQSLALDQALIEVAQEAEVNLIPIYTNVRKLGDDGVFWSKAFLGAALASVAHILGKRLTKVLIAASFDIARMEPFGSHPLIDHNYSSQNLQIVHDGERFSRFHKTQVISEWKVALKNVRPCSRNPEGKLNCGKCEKCIRTMTAFVALGKLSESQAFPLDNVSPELLQKLQIFDIGLLNDSYKDPIPDLMKRGRYDLVAAIQNLIESYKPWSEWRELALQDITSYIPQKATFILADEDGWGTDEFVDDRRRIPFTEKEGKYWGSPPDDETAIHELERLSQSEAKYLVIGWPAFWYLEYYTDFSKYLHSNYRCFLENERLMMFDLQDKLPEAHNKPIKSTSSYLLPLKFNSMTRHLKSLRIAQVAPLWTSVPPATYGGTELIVHLLTEELVRCGYDVTLFATGDSQTSAKLRPVCESNLIKVMRDGGAYQYEHYANASICEAMRDGNSFDLIHCHLGCAWIPLTALSATSVLHSIGSAVTVDDQWILNRYPNLIVTFRTYSQIATVPPEDRKNIRVIYNACNFEAFEFSEQAGKYFAFLGRMSPEKNPLGAIQIAKEVGLPIVLAGEPMIANEQQYFKEKIRPLIDGVSVIYWGPVNHAQKNDLLKNATALLFPIQWSEPFGIVMIEAMACGTPVVACKKGSVAEVIDFGKTGFYAESVEELTSVAYQAMSLNRYTVREHAKHRFSVRRMVDDYIELYESLVERGTHG